MAIYSKTGNDFPPYEYEEQGAITLWNRGYKGLCC